MSTPCDLERELGNLLVVEEDEFLQRFWATEEIETEFH